MPSLIETAIYAVAAVIVLSVLACVASLVFFPVKASETEDDGLTSTPERRYRDAAE